MDLGMGFSRRSGLLFREFGPEGSLSFGHVPLIAFRIDKC